MREYSLNVKNLNIEVHITKGDRSLPLSHSIPPLPWVTSMHLADLCPHISMQMKCCYTYLPSFHHMLSSPFNNVSLKSFHANTCKSLFFPH